MGVKALGYVVIDAEDPNARSAASYLRENGGKLKIVFVRDPSCADCDGWLYGVLFRDEEAASYRPRSLKEIGNRNQQLAFKTMTDWQDLTEGFKENGAELIEADFAYTE